MRLPITLTDLCDRSIAPASFPAAPGRATLEQGYLVFLSLAAVNFIANFFFMAQFGIYEDDYYLTIPSIGLSFSEVAAQVKSALLTWPQGRPVWWALQISLSSLLGLAKAIWPFYLFSFALTSCAGFALFTFLRRLVSLPAAFLAAVFFLLFPADTSKQIFMHQLVIGLSTLMVLVASFLYLNGNRVRAYLLGAVMLLTYEPYFLLLFFMPALGVYRERREMIVVLVRNGVVLALILVSVLLIRKILGEERAADVMSGELPSYLGRALRAPWIGGWTVLLTCVARPLESLLHASMPQRLLSAAGAGVVFFTGWMLWKARRPDPASSPETPASSPPGLSRDLRLQYLGFGLGMCLFSYLYRFYPGYFPPNVTLGRLSALHAVGAFGVCLAIAVLLDWAMASRPRHGTRTIAAAAVYLGLLVGFFVEVQETQYVKNWVQQKAFLESVLEQIGDLDEDDVILVDTRLPEGTTVDRRPVTEGFHEAWMVNSPVKVFPRLFETPEGWEAGPELYGIYEGMPMERVPDGLRIATPIYYGSELQPVISNGNFLFFEFTDAGLARSENPVVFEGEAFLPKPPSGATSRRHPETWLYRMLFEPGNPPFKPDNRPLWRTLIPSRSFPNQPQ